MGTPIPPHVADGLSPEFREAVASVRLEELEPGPDALELFRRVSAGELTIEQARMHILSRYRRHARKP